MLTSLDYWTNIGTKSKWEETSLQQATVDGFEGRLQGLIDNEVDIGADIEAENSKRETEIQKTGYDGHMKATP